MPITFTELLRDEALRVSNRRDVRSLYDEVKRAVREGELDLEGHSLPTTLNAWIREVEGKGKELKNDVDTVEFSLAENAALKRWRQAQAREAERGDASARSVYVSPNSHALFDRVKELERANEASLGVSNGKKDDILGALSDLQAAVGLFLHTYDGVRGALKLPDRALPADKVKVRKKR